MSSIYNAYIPESPYPYREMPEDAPPESCGAVSGLLKRLHIEKLGHGELLVLLVFLLLLREGDRSDALITLGIAAVLLLLDGGSVEDGSVRQGELDFLF